jgi:hypothetical protein
MKKMKYFAKKEPWLPKEGQVVADGGMFEAWFAPGTECFLIDDYRPQWDAGLFRGLRICENPEAECGLPVGTHRENDEEICSFDEFEIIEIDE